MSLLPGLDLARDLSSGPARGQLFMVISCAAFAVMMALVRKISASVHPFEAAFFRNLLGVVFMLPWLMHAGIARLNTGRMRIHVLRSTFGLCAMLCPFLSLSLMPLADATALSFTSPMFGTIGAALFLNERVRLRRWMATGVGFIGALIVLRPGVASFQPASLIALAAAIFIAAAMLSVKSLSKTEHPNAIVMIMGLFMTPASLIPALFVWRWPAPEAWPWLLLMGLSATIGQVFLTRAFGVGGDASAILPFDFSRLVFAALLGYLMFDQVPDLWTWLGATVIVGSSLYIVQREAKLRRRTGAEAPTERDPAGAV